MLVVAFVAEECHIATGQFAMVTPVFVSFRIVIITNNVVVGVCGICIVLSIVVVIVIVTDGAPGRFDDYRTAAARYVAIAVTGMEASIATARRVAK